MTRQNRPGKAPLLGSAAIHGIAVALAWWSSAFRPEPLVFESFAIELVSPPPAEVAPEPTPAAPVEELVIERPEPEPEPPKPTPPVPEKEPEVKVEPKPEPPKPEPPKPEPPKPEPPAETKPEPARAPEAKPAETSGENINVRMEGLRRDYPEYYNNIVRQIQRCFRAPEGARGETIVYFVIRKDGTVTDTRFAKQSGNPALDFEALGAVADCAGRGRFGPLPDDLPYERLPIQFSFRPAGAGQ